MGQMYMGQMYMGQMYMGQMYMGQMYMGQMYMGQMYMGQMYMGQMYMGQMYMGTCRQRLTSGPSHLCLGHQDPAPTKIKKLVEFSFHQLLGTPMFVEVPTAL